MAIHLVPLLFKSAALAYMSHKRRQTKLKEASKK